MNFKHFLFSLILVISQCLGQSVVTTVHNLSSDGPGTIKASSESEVCIFCHTPHQSSPRTPLWNKADPGTVYTLYHSSTLQSDINNPMGSSVLCLSCHDGFIALGDVLSRPVMIEFHENISTMPVGDSNLEDDLSDDHPISFLYNSTLYASDNELADPSTLPAMVRLENEYVQCTSCHDPHNNDLGYFLVESTQFSDLCGACHNKTNWSYSSHSTSSATWNGSGTNPWPHSEFSTVAENACENCHDPHNSDGVPRLLNYNLEESNCLVCHNGNVADKNIQSVFSDKLYIHDIFNYNDDHDANESNLVSIIHVECEDCHNPHQSNSNNVSDPDGSGVLAGVKGIDLTGGPVNQIEYQYELCFRCHASTTGMPASPTIREVDQNNLRYDFNTTNPSFHPVTGNNSANGSVPSLISPYDEFSIIYCTDCHGSDNPSDPAGPHGSNNAHILKYQYITVDGTIESEQNYALCYTCHNRDIILDTSTLFGANIHYKHIVEENTPCNVCHDPHGVDGDLITSGSHTRLINFDLSVVSPNANGVLEFTDNGDFHGSCFLSCHFRNHGMWASY